MAARPWVERVQEKVDRSAGPTACHPWTGNLGQHGTPTLSVINAKKRKSGKRPPLEADDYVFSQGRQWGMTGPRPAHHRCATEALMVTAAYRLLEHQIRLLRLMRDSRPCRITPREAACQFRTVRHLGRMGLVEYTGGSGTWSATITEDGLRALWREHNRTATP